MSDSESEPETKRRRHNVQVYDWDFTFFGTVDLLAYEEFIKLIQPLFRKWVFQLEECPTTKRRHYQGRGALFKKKRHGELVKLLNDTQLKGMHVTECSNESRTKEAFYSLKYDTRIDGPWDDVSYEPPPFIPFHLQGLENHLYPWQQAILDTRTIRESRTINLLYNPEGCKGKSTIARFAQLHYKALRLPPVGDHKQLLEAACDILMGRNNHDPKLAFIDLPRGLTTDKRRFGPFLIAIEEIKGGVVADMRNRYKEWWLHPPQVWVFCNHLPDLNHLSADRWRFWVIDETNELVRKNKQQLIQMSQSSEN